MATFDAPDRGMAVRMYRQGHGDCYLLAIPNEDPAGGAVRVLIDCGYKPGSQNFLKPPRDPEEILQHIQDSTDKKLDLVIVTHEHQDHVNLFTKKRSNGSTFFEEMEIHHAWFAWTESPTDRLAKKLRRKHGDVLLRLINARNQLAGMALDGDEDPVVKRLDALLELELGDGVLGSNLRGFAANDLAWSGNKEGMKRVKDAAGDNVQYLSPGQSILIPGTRVRAYVLGPPRRESLLTDEDPREDEEFPQGLDSRAMSFGAAVEGKGAAASPFAREHCIAAKTALTERHLKGHFLRHYGKEGLGVDDEESAQVPDNADWRRIDHDWLYTAEQLALKLNTGVNNTSLVIAFELPESGRVLLFVGDAQRGNWVSWDDKPCVVDGRTVTARELLGRTMLYKVGHHGSHNATLAGELDSDHPNLSWIGAEKFGDEFVAMINAVNAWAMTNNPPWRHPLPSIAEALHEKALGRVFQTDRKPVKPRGPDVSTATWNAFKRRSTFHDLFFDYIVKDD